MFDNCLKNVENILENCFKMLKFVENSKLSVLEKGFRSEQARRKM